MNQRGRAWVFGDDISTDHIAAGRYFHLRSNLTELAKHVLEDARNDFAGGVKEGDLVVAGKNFGTGSSREHAPTIIKMVGVRAILARSFARIFYRNCFNIGLLALVCDTSGISDGDILEVNFEEGVVGNLTKRGEIRFSPLPKVLKAVLEEGGLIPYVQKHGDLEL